MAFGMTPIHRDAKPDAAAPPRSPPRNTSWPSLSGPFQRDQSTSSYAHAFAPNPHLSNLPHSAFASHPHAGFLSQPHSGVSTPLHVFSLSMPGSRSSSPPITLPPLKVGSEGESDDGRDDEEVDELADDSNDEGGRMDVVKGETRKAQKMERKPKSKGRRGKVTERLPGFSQFEAAARLPMESKMSIDFVR